MYLAKITVTLSENSDGTYRVISLVNTTQLSIGQDIPRDMVAGWNTRPHVTTRIIGRTTEESGNLDLLASPTGVRQINDKKPSKK